MRALEQAADRFAHSLLRADPKRITDVTSLIKGKRPQIIDQFLYVFLGEGGNFDFTAGGTPYFLLTSIVKERPFAAYQDMTELKYDLIETGANIEYFHAAEDAQATRKLF